jgi:hypothetical protein
VCLGCNETKSVAEFVPIKIRPGAYYPRCRTCRNDAARARYDSAPEIRASELERTQRNRRRRLASRAKPAVAERPPTFDQIVPALSKATGIDASIILEPDRVYEARAVLAYLLRTDAQLSAADVVRLFGRSTGTVRDATRRHAPETRHADLIAHVRGQLASANERVAKKRSHPKAESGLLYGLPARQRA